jgi:hypothetical protein
MERCGEFVVDETGNGDSAVRQYGDHEDDRVPAILEAQTESMKNGTIFD